MTDKDNATGIGAFIVTVAPNVTSIIINDGSLQRSMVRSVTVNFDDRVVAEQDSFIVRNYAGSSVPFILEVVSGSSYRLRFTGTGGSLDDGQYTLTVRSSLVSSSGIVLPHDVTQTFFRQFGDGDGDGDVDSLDISKIRPASNMSNPNYKWYFDFDNDGDVDSADIIAATNRRGTRLF